MWIIGGFVLGALFLLMAFKPMQWWRATEGWKYRNPDAVAPSDTVLGLNSAFAIVAAVVCIIGGFVLQHQSVATVDLKPCPSASSPQYDPDTAC